MWRLLDLAAWRRRHLVLLTLAIALTLFLVDLSRGDIAGWPWNPVADKKPQPTASQPSRPVVGERSYPVAGERSYPESNLNWLNSVEYADIAAEFSARFKGPYVIRTNARSLFIAPGIDLSVAQENAARAIPIDITVSAQGQTSWAHEGDSRFDIDGTRIPPRDAEARRLVQSWTFHPFERWGYRKRMTIRNVPVRLLTAEASPSGVIAFRSVNACKRFKILRTRSSSYIASLSTLHTAEIRETGEITFEGDGEVLVPGSDRAMTTPGAARRTFESILSADLQQLSASGGMIHSEGGEWGELKFRCDGRVLLMARVAPEPGADRNIDKEVEALGIDRWTIGSDETANVLAARSWNFMNASPANMRLIKGVAENGSVKGILDLARRGAPLAGHEQTSVEERERANALAIKARRGDGEAVAGLLASNIDWSKQQRTEALAAAIRRADFAMMDRLIASGADPRGSIGSQGTTMLMLAAAVGRPDLIARILKYDRRVNKQDAESNRPLAYLMSNHPIRYLLLGRSSAPPPSLEDFERSLTLLIAVGADVNAANNRKHTVLMHSRSIEVAETLIKHGANVNARDENGMTPLMHLRQAMPIVQLLLKHGADPNAKGVDGQTALNQGVAADVAQLLIDRGADVDRADANGETPLLASLYDERTVRLLIAKGADVNARGEYGRTALMKCPRFEVAQMLLDAGADPYLRNARGQSAIDELDVMMKAGFSDLSSCGGMQALRLWLIEHGRR